MSFLKHRPHRKHVLALWPGHKPKQSVTTDDIPPPAELVAERQRTLSRHASDPVERLLRPHSTRTLQSSPPTPSAPGRLSKKIGMATVTFAKAGVEPPVFIVTSMSTPPWEVLQMQPSKETEHGPIVFSYTFDNVQEGDYQYKIRIGDGQWVVDESAETTTDVAGNQNNVYHHIVKSQMVEEKGETIPQIPLPFTVVEKVQDQQQPSYGDVEPANLEKDSNKRTADAEPDIEIAARPTSPPDTPNLVEAPLAPVVIVEKVDGRLSFGDDFGDAATSSQKLAHEQRAADAMPDKVVTSTPENAGTSHVEPGTEEERAAPLFQHESFDQGFNQSRGNLTPPRGVMQSISEVSPSPPAGGTMDKIAEESQSSACDSPSEVCEYDDDDDDFGSELDRCPTLDHESFEYTNRSIHDSVLARESPLPRRRQATKLELRLEHENDEPLLFPHEKMDRNSPTAGPTARSSSSYKSLGSPTYESEMDSSAGVSPDRSGYVKGYFMGRHLGNPRNDGKLEEFPTSREQILERVYTLQMENAPDQPNGIGSPASVFSQDCSSVDLPRFRSTASLNAVAEEEGSESEAMSDLPSPIPGLGVTVGQRNDTHGDASQHHMEEGNTDKTGSDDSTRQLTKEWMEQVFEPLTTPNSELKPLERPRTAAASAPDTITRSGDKLQASDRRLSSDSMKIESAGPVGQGVPSEEPFPYDFVDYRTPTPAASQNGEQNVGCLKAFFRTLFARYSEANSSTRGAILAAGFALVAYYIFSVALMKTAAI